MTSRHILLVSGPSGGGKSTFIRQLAERALPPEILALLPDHSGSWPVIEANDVLKGNLSGEPLLEISRQPGGLLVHYDIVFIHCYGLARYEDDPAMKLMTQADSLHAVFVRPDYHVVRRQFFDRKARRQKTKSKASLLWGRFVRHPLRQALAPFTGKPTLSTEALYGGHQWLAGCYRDWEAFLRRLKEQHPNANILIVEPDSGPGEPPKFRLAANLGAAATNAPPS